jgi:hypothetical protein
MAILIRLRELTDVPGSPTSQTIRTSTEITVDYPDEPSLPQYIRWQDKLYRKVGATVNYRVFAGLDIVDLSGNDSDKIVET